MPVWNSLRKDAGRYLLTGLLLFSGVCIFSCGTSFDRKFHRVTEIIDGNTIRVENGVTIHLTGVQDNGRGAAYLERTLLNQNIRVVFDSRYRENPTSPIAEIHAYVVRHDRLSINGDMLKSYAGDLEESYLNDSLEVFRNYSLGGGSEGIGLEIEGSDGPNTGKPPKLVDLIKQIEPAVFIIYSYDQYGNQEGLGTGFFISDKGIGVSNHHVLSGGSTWTIETNSNEKYQIKDILYQSEENDYVVFSIDVSSGSFPFLNLSTRSPQIGEDIIVVGNPQGLSHTLTKGVLSAFRSVNSENDYLQIDAAVSPGSSGSPVCDEYGWVIGVVTSQRLDCQMCNFAINIRIILDAIKQ